MYDEFRGLDMISFIEWLSSLFAAFALRMRGASKRLMKKARAMKADRVKKLMSKDSLSERQSKELERLVKNLPEVTVIGGE